MHNKSHLGKRKQFGGLFECQHPKAINRMFGPISSRKVTICNLNVASCLFCLVRVQCYQLAEACLRMRVKFSKERTHPASQSGWIGQRPQNPHRAGRSFEDTEDSAATQGGPSSSFWKNINITEHTQAAFGQVQWFNPEETSH